MKQVYPIVAVHTTDQAYYGGTYDPRTKEFELIEIIIVGHLIRNDSEKVVVATEHCDDHDVRYVHVLPWEGISKVQELTVVDKEVERGGRT